MNQARDEQPLHKTLHFRRLRELIVALSNYEHLNIEQFNLNRMKSYRTMGINLRGKNVITGGIGTNSCFVENNHYNVIEVPVYGKENKHTGKFLFLAQNTDFNYYIFGFLNVSIDYKKTKETGKLNERVNFTILGKYTSSVSNENKIEVFKELSGAKMIYSTSAPTEKYFDSFGNRKSAFKVDAIQLAAKICGKTVKTDPFIGTENVKIYKKKNNRNKRY